MRPATTTSGCDICRTADELGWWGPGFYAAHGSKAAHCRDCHETWTGGAAQHCVGCHQTFSSESAADKAHLIGPQAELFCCSPEERGLVWNEKRRMWSRPASRSHERRFGPTHLRFPARKRRGRTPTPRAKAERKDGLSAARA